MSVVTFSTLGTIHSPFKEIAGMPIQNVGAKGVPGWIEMEADYAQGLQDIEGFSHLILIYHLHLMREASLTVTPFLDTDSHGIFATRSPKRPNPIGLSVVRLIKVEGATLHIEDVDVVDGTPLLDIKPYVPAFDARETERIGWFAKNIDKATQARAQY